MIKKIRWFWWRLTGYRELSKLLHHYTGGYDALTPVGISRMEELAKKEKELYYRGAIE